MNSNIAEKFLSNLQKVGGWFQRMTSKEARTAYKQVQDIKSKFLDALAERGYEYKAGKVIAAAEEDKEKAAEAVDSEDGVRYNRRRYQPQKFSFQHKNFPSETENQSEAHRLAVWWANRSETETGDQTLISMNGKWYLVEKFDDSTNHYQVEDSITEAKYKTIAKEIKEYGRSGHIKSIQKGTNGIDLLNQRTNTVGRKESSADRNETGYRGQDHSIQRMGEEEVEGGEQSSSDRSGDREGSGSYRQGDSIRFSRVTPEQDRAYMQAVENGDMETAQKMVDEAAKRAGYTDEMWHGAKGGKGFTKFKNWSYFTEDREYAEKYSGRNPENIYGVYVKMDYPFDTRTDDKARREFEKARIEYGMSNLDETGLPDWTDGYDIVNFIEENGLNYDGVALDEGAQLHVQAKNYEERYKHVVSYIVKNSAQVKSSDTITYDDNGNVIPLSQRFNPSNPDIRFSRAENNSARQNSLDNAEEKGYHGSRGKQSGIVTREDAKKTLDGILKEVENLETDPEFYLQFTGDASIKNKSEIRDMIYRLEEAKTKKERRTRAEEIADKIIQNGEKIFSKKY